ncbi:uncharacterized protein LOC118433046 [Folsomia candida]|uniref:Inactive pancreatic lipase-related protein 1 n=1 Tax=Folsomia candida TaxID=158441 RepID=A0A226D3D3_FOLCA|nr:uncharacterized protein LOC118433046 [Folsomia candida]OXA39384.1 Inactive pancreatic lipase-related protein 1 [Folsomia candida]
MASIYTTLINQQHALIVHSPFVQISQWLNQVEEIMEQKSKAGQPIVNVCFIAKEELQIDENLRQDYWHGKNVVIISKTVKVTKPCQWNVSGVDGAHASSQPAQNGKEWGDPGQNGEDGSDGENGGSVYFLVEDCHNLNHLRIKVNGGNGGRGQPGGNGCNGKPGTDGFELSLKDLKEKFPPDCAFSKVQSELEIVEKQTQRFIQGTTKQRLHMTFAVHSAIFRTHIYFLVKGSQGTLGGPGGVPGRGGAPGRSGLAGKVTEIKIGGIDKLEVQELQSIVEATDGLDGQGGNPGNAGKRVPGKVGRDVGYVAWAAIPHTTVYYGPGYLKLDTCEDPNDPINPGVWCAETSKYVRIVVVPAIPVSNDDHNVYRDYTLSLLQSVPPILPRKEHYKLSTEEIIMAYLPLLSKESAESEKTQIFNFYPSINAKPLYPKLSDINLNDYPIHNGGMNNPGTPQLANADFINPKALPVPKDISKIKPILNLKSAQYVTPTDVPAVHALTVVDELLRHIARSFLADLKLVIITHGFKSNAKETWVTSMQNEILKHHPTYIVVLLDWSSGSGGFSYAKAAANCLEVGKQLGKLIVYIKEAFSKQKIATHVWGIGHSLGSHLMGAAGRYCLSQNKLINRITGLDPAGVGFENFTAKMLCSKDASFVDVIHTDGYHKKEKPPQKIFNATLAQFDDNPLVNFGPFGTMKPCGHADFYPNSGYCQPGHNTWSNYTIGMGTLSHSMAHALFTATIGNKGLFETSQQFEEAPEMKKSPRMF